MAVGIFYKNVQSAYPEYGDNPCAVLDVIADMGAKYIELDYKDYIKYGNEFKEKLDSLNMYARFYIHTDKYLVYDGKNRVDILFPVLRDLDVKELMLVVANNTEPKDKKEAEDTSVAIINELCDESEKYGITLLFEDFDGANIPCGDINDMLRFGEKIPKLRFTFDTGNFMFFDEDEICCYRKLKGKIRHVHAKDRTKDKRSYATGEGCLKIKELIYALTEDGYYGDFTAEMFGYKDKEGIKRSVKFLINTVEEAKARLENEI